MRFKALSAALVASALALTACGDGGGEGGGDKGTDFITVAAGGTSGPYYAIGATMAKTFQEKLGSESSVQATGASVENVQLIADGKAELAFAMGDATRQAMEGTGPFKDNKHEDLTALTALYPNHVQIITTEKSGIKSVADMKGKRIGVGDSGSGVELNAQMILEAHDMTYEDIEEDFLSYSEAIDQMKNGQVDAAFVTSGLPNASVLDLVTSADVVVVPIEGDGMKKLLELYPFFSEDKVPGGTYDQEEDITTASIMNQMLMSPDLSEEAGYEIAKAFWEDIEKIQGSHNAAKQITLDSVTDGLVPDLHPGAKKYYEEVGADIG